MAKAATPKVEDFTAEAKKTFEQGAEKVTKGLEEATKFGQENVEAVVASSKIAAKAAEELNAEIVAFSKKSYEDGVAVAKELTSCKSVSEFVEKQNDFAKASFDGFMAQAAKMNDLYAAAAKNAMQPLSARFNAAVDMAKEYQA